MKSKVLTILIFVLSVAVLFFARQQETLPQLMARADAASSGQQADLCMEVAERQVKLAIAAYKANKSDELRDSLQQIVKYADKGHSAAIQSGKRLKHTEIKLRQVALHLRDLKSDVDVDDQPLVQAAVDKLEDFRTEILKNMFGSKSND
jgi:ABC-type oligopeptide transport system substrate-binding subunit